MTVNNLTSAPSVSDRMGRAPRAPRPMRSRTSRLLRMIPLAPAIVLMAIFLIGPIVWSFYGSFTNAALTGIHASQVDFIGFANYTKLFGDPAFPLSVGLSVVFVLG